MNMITTVTHADRILVLIGDVERSFSINEFCTRKQAKREAKAFCNGFAECARIMGNRLHLMMAEAHSIEF